MRQLCLVPLVAAALLICTSAASAQVSITGAIAGTVRDDSDAVIPGASVQLLDEGTGVQKQTVTNQSGDFAFRDLSSGSYQVTVALAGFQTAIFKKVIVESGRTTDLRVKLGLGGLEQAVTVEGTTPVLEMTSNVISSTIGSKQMNELPLAGRSAFGLARLVPGVVAPQGGGTHYNGMPGGTINPTVDGVNNSSNGFKSGGTSFFATVPPRLGAVEEVTIETAGLGGDDGVTGGVNLKFITRRGTNQYHGSVFEQYRTDKLNANTCGNVARGIAKDQLRRHDFGGNFGGPIIATGRFRNKLFGFVNHETEWIPQTQTRTQTVLTPEAQLGIFRYATASGEQRTVNVLSMAGQAGLQSTPDPIIGALLARQAEARQYGTIEGGQNLRTDVLSWREPQKAIDTFPTTRIDFQARSNLSFMMSYNRRNQDQQGRRVWPIPGFPINSDTFDAGWWVFATGTNWTISPNMHNELRYGIQHSGDTNERGRQREFFNLNGIVNGLPARFQLPIVPLLVADNAPVIGKHYITTITNTLTMLRGNHSITMGGNYRDTQWRDRSLDGSGTGGYLGLPRYAIGVAGGDPIESLFSTTTIPGLQTADQAQARQLYALLTGRLTEIRTGGVIDPATLQYSDAIFRENWTSARFGGLFLQDRWRVTPNFTLNAGLRYEFNTPPFNHTGTVAFPDDANIYGPSSDLFEPGVLDGVPNPVFRRAKTAAGTDWMNVAPRVGFAWTPNFGDGMFGRIFGTGQETVIRGGWDITFFDEGTNMFASTAGNNTGQSQARVFQAGQGFPIGSLTLQNVPAVVPYQPSPAAYQDVWNQSELTFVNSLGSMFSDLETPYVQAWNIGIQRLVAKNTVLEVRYVGNRAEKAWHAFSLNEVNIFENGFLPQFVAAQRNLEAFRAANPLCGQTGQIACSFANNGLPGQVPLPIFEAAFGARGSQGAVAAGSGFSNGGFISSLENGEAGRLATSLATNQTYLCRMVGNTFSPCVTGGRNYNAPGPYAMNFFQVNPYAVNGLTVVDDDGWSTYHALQLNLRHRYTNGLAVNMNYTLARNRGNLWTDNATQTVNYFTLRDKSMNDAVAQFDVRHVFQAYGTYDLPFGRGRRVDIGNSVLNALAGGWTLGGIFTVQSGTPFRLFSGRQTVNGSDAGVVLKNGHTVEEIQSMIGIRPHPTDNSWRYFVDPRLIGPDGRANPEYLDVPTTPGEWGQRIYLRGVNTWVFDMSLNKTTTLVGRTQITVHVTAQNVLNRPIWGAPNWNADPVITSTTFGISTNPTNNNTPRNLYSRVTISF
jgi:hypothetical protein